MCNFETMHSMYLYSCKYIFFITVNLTFFHIDRIVHGCRWCKYPYLILLSLLSVCLSLVWRFWELMAASQSDSEFVRHKASGSSCNMHSCTHAHNHPYYNDCTLGHFVFQFNYIPQQALGYYISFHMVVNAATIQRLF